MKIYGKCKDCNEIIRCYTDSYTRIELAMSKGEVIKLKCKKCGSVNEIHVNDFYAKESKIALMISGIILLIGTPLLFILVSAIASAKSAVYNYYVIGGFLLVPAIMYGLIRKQDQTRVNAFNRLKLDK